MRRLRIGLVMLVAGIAASVISAVNSADATIATRGAHAYALCNYNKPPSEKCNEPQKLITAPAGAEVTAVFDSGPDICGPLRVYIYAGGVQVSMSPFTAARPDGNYALTGTDIPSFVVPGKSGKLVDITVDAEGMKGGCNDGKSIYNWAADFTLKVVTAGGTDPGPPSGGPPPPSPPGTPVATVRGPLRGNAYVQTGGSGPVKPLRVGDVIKVGDVIGVSPGSFLYVDFAIGGGVALQNGEVTIASERSVKGTRTLKQTLDFGCSCGRNKEPLEINPRDPSVSGIKG